MEKRGSYEKIGIAVFLILGFSLVLVSAGLIDWFQKTITGKASSQPTNLTITVSGVNPAVIEYVSPISDVSLNDGGGTTGVTFYVTMSDADGVSDLNDSSVSANFTKTDESVRFNNSCVHLEDIDANRANYSCTIDLWYWDEAGDWNISVRGKDLGNMTWVYNLTTNVTLLELKSLVIFPISLTWPAISPDATNQTSDNDPTTVNNTGNYNGTIRVTGIDLHGETDSDYRIYAGNFTVGLTTGAGNPECAGDALQNDTMVTITGSVANRGNLSEGGSVGQEELYHCIFHVPANLSSQTYSTSTGGSWTILYG